jgi:hypothetical protein
VDLEGWSRDDSWELGLGEGMTAELEFEKGLSRLVRRRLGRNAVFHEGDGLGVTVEVARPGRFLNGCSAGEPGPALSGHPPSADGSEGETAGPGPVYSRKERPDERPIPSAA